MSLSNLIERLVGAYGEPVVTRWLESGEARYLKARARPKKAPQTPIRPINEFLKTLTPNELGQLKSLILGGNDSERGGL